MSQIGGLDHTYAPDEREISFELLPKGTYLMMVKSFKEWEGKNFPTLEVTQYDAKYQALKGADGKTTKVTHNNVVVYTNDVTLEVLDGPLKGRIIFYRLSTHPNTPWVIARFVRGLGAGNVAPIDLPKFVGVPMMVDVIIDTYPKEDMTDTKTGEPIFKNSKSRNACLQFKPIEQTF